MTLRTAFLFCLSLMFAGPLWAQTNSDSASLRAAYPGGIDEDDLQVQEQLHPPERKYHPKVIFNKQLNSFEAVKDQGSSQDEE